MSFQQKTALWLRCSLMLAVVTTTFWLIWSLFIGPVPVVHEVVIGPLVFSLPFEVSRWTDVLMGPLWLGMFVTVIARNDLRDWTGKQTSVFFSLGAGLLCGLMFALPLPDCPITWAHGVALGAGSSSIGCLIGAVLGRPLVVGNIAGGFLAGAAVGTITGGIVPGLVFSGVGIAAYGVGLFCTAPFWGKFGRWLIARDKVT